jgi:hypothetical protein
MSTSGLSWELEARGGVTYAALTGEITEASDFASLSQKLPAQFVLDLAGIHRINSCGIREWLTFVAALNDSRKTFALERCSPTVVSQFNMIRNFTGGSVVRSLLAPYYCATCDREHLELVSITPQHTANLAETLTCAKCGHDMEFDDVPEQFLAFLRERTGEAR